MMPSLDRRSCKPILLMLIPSMTIAPSAGSINRNKDSAIDDFPAPVRPTIPNYTQNE